MRDFAGIMGNVLNPDCGRVTGVYACDNIHRAVLKKESIKKMKKTGER